jgi:hypothetical protein
MSNLSDTGLMLCIAGTTLVVVSFLFSVIASPLFLNLQIVGGIVLVIAITILARTRNEYRTVKMKSGFPLKIDHLIIFICAMSIWTSFYFMIDIGHFMFTGEISYFTIFPVAFLFLTLAFLSIRIAKYKSLPAEKDIPRG